MNVFVYSFRTIFGSLKFWNLKLEIYEKKNLEVKYTGQHLKHIIWNEKHIWTEFLVKERKLGAPQNWGWVAPARGAASMRVRGDALAGRRLRVTEAGQGGFNLTKLLLKNINPK